MTSGPPDLPRRRSIRLPACDYTNAGAYFVTICGQDGTLRFGVVEKDAVMLDALGRAVADAWLWLSDQCGYVALDEWVVMPNHLHGIIVIGSEGAGGSRTAPTGDPGKRKSLGRLVGAFKTVSTKRINEIRQTPGLPLWQRNYYEHVIRNEDELNRVRQYIQHNPARWAMDRENPNRIIPVPVDGDGL